MTAETQTPAWPIWKKIIFRFFFAYLILQTAPWTWFDSIPGVEYVTRYYYQFMDWLVNLANAKIFHVRPVLVPVNGSGDTSYGWTQVWLFVSLAAIGCLIWSILDRKRRAYAQLNYWLCIFTRYYICTFAFLYGILKLFAMQMIFPSLHQLATPLGDLLPMRFSWLFIGYSTQYQVFSGIAEVLAGLLLLNRRTATLGVLVATAVFTNVMMLNMSYDIPVKIFSAQLVLCCLYLLANESGRLWNFFILNKPAPVSHIYDFGYSKKWTRIGRIAAKAVFIIIAVGMQIYGDIGYYKDFHKAADKQPVKNGVYEVTVYQLNQKNIPLSLSDSVRWQDAIFEDGYGSIKTTDTLFRHRYGRGYFSYMTDKKMPGTLWFKNNKKDSLAFRLEMPDSSTIRLWGKENKDSLYVELKRVKRHFQLAERQFHWLSEYNR